MKNLFVTVSMIAALCSCASKTEKADVNVKSETQTAPVNTGMSYLDSLKQFDQLIERDALLASDVTDFYKDNEVKADNALKNKIVVIKDRVKRIGKDFADKAYLTFEGQKYDITSLQCYFKDPNQLADLSSGENVVIAGICTGKSMNVILKDCILLRK